MISWLVLLFCSKQQPDCCSGVSPLGVPGVPWHPQILADQLTLSQPGVTDYAHLITTGTPGFSDLATVLISISAMYSMHILASTKL